MKTLHSSIAALALTILATPALADQVRALEAPCRVIDTRNGWGILNPGDIMGVRVRHPVTPFVGGEPGCGIPPFASGVILNVAAVGPQGTGHIRVHAYAAVVPVASRLNVTAGINVANELVIGFKHPPLQFDIEIRPTTTTHIIGDIVGYLAPDPETLVGEVTLVPGSSLIYVQTYSGLVAEAYAPPDLLNAWLAAVAPAAPGDCLQVEGFWVTETRFEIRGMPILSSFAC